MPDGPVILAAICDDVRHEVGNKVSLMGIFNQFLIADFQQPLRPFKVYAKLRFTAEGQHTVAFRFANLQGDFNIRMEAPVVATREDPVFGGYTANVEVGVDNLKLPRPGEYQIDISCDGTLADSIPFRVVTVTPPTAH